MSERSFNLKVKAWMSLCIVSCILCMTVMASETVENASGLAETLGRMTVGGILGLVCLASLFVTYKLFVRYTQQADAFTQAVNEFKDEFKKRPCFYLNKE